MSTNPARDASRVCVSRHNAAKLIDEDRKSYFCHVLCWDNRRNFVITQRLWKSQTLASLSKILVRRGVDVPLRAGSFGVQHNGVVFSRLLLGEIHENLQQRERKLTGENVFLSFHLLNCRLQTCLDMLHNHKRKNKEQNYQPQNNFLLAISISSWSYDPNWFHSAQICQPTFYQVQ